ncbi:DUF971 domain-containing protein [Aureimonas fodinaquatilis]|uniref:DUF971 domain-containing protein n=1 Tax=Aureimonas fodinaquatilis TaxID=2565783 RepID=A0A5B0DYA0_9HYPH|nr:DUF971 domain-containing protein [Aureimonas fodinaquatilis]KAA0970189.1 DUF971 domain-containing protein [Aureimonas fodinaquatilis]
MSQTVAPPREIRVSKDRAVLTVVGPQEGEHSFSAEMLRVLSPSAEVQGHSPEQRVTVGGKRNVKIADVRPVGNYAIRIVFDDHHDSGLYSWAYLAQLASEHETRWQSYLDELTQKGLSR